jgi:hypothetical protein
MGRKRTRVPTVDHRHTLWRLASIVDGDRGCPFDAETPQGVIRKQKAASAAPRWPAPAE